MSTITISSSQPWRGLVQATGNFTVYVDKSKAGVLPADGTVAFQVEAGAHTIRIRRQGAASPLVNVLLEEGETVGFRAEVPMEGSLLNRMGALLFNRSTWLRLGPIESDGGTTSPT
jgi:hypothetical protein